MQSDKILSWMILLCCSAVFGQELITDKTGVVQPDSTMTQSVEAEQVREKDKKFTDRLFSGELQDRDYISLASVIVASVSLIFGIYQYRKRKEISGDRVRAELEEAKKFEDEQKVVEITTAKGAYKSILRSELGSIQMVGAPELSDKELHLPEVFVHLCISEEYKSDEHQVIDASRGSIEREDDFKPNDMLKRAFDDYGSRLLLIIGDPGSGKTTLLKHYSLTCLKPDGHKTLNLQKPHFPIFLSLRNLDTSKNLAENLDARITTHKDYLKEEVFNKWLEKESTLIMLDGLDEVSELDSRKIVCKWIEEQHNAFSKARFIVTSRWAGYRKTDGVRIEVKHLRADIRDFTVEQQEDFLKNWFTAAYLADRLPKEGRTAAWEKSQKEKANAKATTVIARLQEEDNLSLSQLAGIPIILQIMAIIWKEREYLPHNRQELYDVALNYLLEHRDSHRGLTPKLPAKDARTVLAPVALWLQEDLKADEAEKTLMHAEMQPHLDQMESQLSAKDLCKNLRDRAGLIADYGDKNQYYIFRHKSFREYLSAQQLLKKYTERGRIQALIKNFGKDWWDEPLRFMFAEAEDGEFFDKFMKALFNSKVSHEISQKKQALLFNLVREARRRKTDALISALNSPKMNLNQQFNLLECLKIIASETAFAGIKAFSASGAVHEGLQSYVEEILREADSGTKKNVVFLNLFEELPPSFINPVENNAEYILVPAGTLRYSEDEKEYPIPDIYFGKYPVTNKRYRIFINYLDNRELEMKERLPFEAFTQQLEKSGIISSDELDTDNKNLIEMFRSRLDEDRKLGEESQPVVGVSWYAAKAYCLWLSLLQAVEDGISPDTPIEKLKTVYRLPHEKEWERAAAGSLEEGGPRIYPWPADKGDPSEKLCNFSRNVGTTTPVGHYPEGATPHGLHDMAGNVQEWQDNLWSQGYTVRVIRGGSWFSSALYVRAASRFRYAPDDRFYYVGFRCARVQNP